MQKFHSGGWFGYFYELILTFFFYKWATQDFVDLIKRTVIKDLRVFIHIFTLGFCWTTASVEGLDSDTPLTDLTDYSQK